MVVYKLCSTFRRITVAGNNGAARVTRLIYFGQNVVVVSIRLYTSLCP